MFASFDKCFEENNEKKYIKGSKYVEPALNHEMVHVVLTWLWHQMSHYIHYKRELLS